MRKKGNLNNKSLYFAYWSRITPAGAAGWKGSLIFMMVMDSLHAERRARLTCKQLRVAVWRHL